MLAVTRTHTSAIDDATLSLRLIFLRHAFISFTLMAMPFHTRAFSLPRRLIALRYSRLHMPYAYVYLRVVAAADDA